jgi:hypothetical protein
MKKQSTRRFFLRNTLMAAIGCSVLPSLAIEANTKEELISPASNSNLQLEGLTGKEIIVKGKIYNKTGLVTRSDASLEVWYLSPETKKYKYCKNIVLNDGGEFELATDFPAKELGKLPRLHFKVATKEKSYKTELLVNDFGAYISDKHWELNKQLGDNIFPVKTDFDSYSELQFNLSI